MESNLIDSIVKDLLWAVGQQISYFHGTRNSSESRRWDVL